MSKRRHKLEDIGTKLRQVEILTAQGRPVGLVISLTPLGDSMAILFSFMYRASGRVAGVAVGCYGSDHSRTSGASS
jgi:hypothetical protein